MNIYHRMSSRKPAAVPKPTNIFSVLADSDSETERDSSIAASIEIAVEPSLVLRSWPDLQDARPLPNPFNGFNQRGRWTPRAAEDGWVSLRPPYEPTTPPYGDPTVKVTVAEPPVTVVVAGAADGTQPRTAQEWADTVRQSLERAEGSRPRVDSAERLKDIRDSLGRLSFFRRPMVVE